MRSNEDPEQPKHNEINKVIIIIIKKENLKELGGDALSQSLMNTG